ncbi:MAG: helix-turn-helix transcriptional regulator [Kofleriaceae bacterium]|nr:helix-turn-helix transcriptional regulator [Kofleriaceae bacterium]
MRKIAQELGISKSALYHYFPTKKALFLASSEAALRFDGVTQKRVKGYLKNTPLKKRVQALLSQVREMEGIFPRELSLLVDYLRGCSAEEVAADSAMKLANQRYEALIQYHLGARHTDAVLALLLGTMLMHYFKGEQKAWGEIEKAMLALLS